jgi:hypothetical protein
VHHVVLAGFEAKWPNLILQVGRGSFLNICWLVLLKIEPIYDLVFNTRQLNIEAASVGGLVFLSHA